jgi:branched-subunit amino acid ABC-type transport system permease component
MNWGLIFSNGFYAALSANAIAYILIATGLNVHFGYSGLVNFGQAGFAAVGAYAAAIAVGRYDWNPVAALGLVLVAGVLLSIFVGLLTLRLRADYLAIVTIAVAEIIRLFANSVRFTWLTGGNDGLQKFNDYLSDPANQAKIADFFNEIKVFLKDIKDTAVSAKGFLDKIFPEDAKGQATSDSGDLGTAIGRALIAGLFAYSCAGFWEIIEFTTDCVMHMGVQHSNTDTMGDIVAGFFGGAVFQVIKFIEHYKEFKFDRLRSFFKN